jgi:hypothetical protein
MIMSPVISIFALVAIAWLFVVACKLDRSNSKLHILAALLQMFGMVTIFGAAIGSPAISTPWLLIGISAALYGTGLWLIATLINESVLGKLQRCRQCSEMYLPTRNDDGYCDACMPPTDGGGVQIVNRFSINAADAQTQSQVAAAVNTASTHALRRSRDLRRAR